MFFSVTNIFGESKYVEFEKSHLHVAKVYLFLENFVFSVGVILAIIVSQFNLKVYLKIHFLHLVEVKCYFKTFLWEEIMSKKLIKNLNGQS